MSEEILIKHCSPTLAGLKTASLFSCEFSDKSELDDFLKKNNKLLAKKGVRMIPLRRSDKSALIYVYRPELLDRDLSDRDAADILARLGYSDTRANHCLTRLRERLCGGEFPHEIGCFLGYPPEDVNGFIDNRAKDCKLVGCWKVYGNVERAKTLFAKYKKCTDVYCRCYEKGRSIDELCVKRSVG